MHWVLPISQKFEAIELERKKIACINSFEQ